MNIKLLQTITIPYGIIILTKLCNLQRNNQTNFSLPLLIIDIFGMELNVRRTMTEVKEDPRNDSAKRQRRNGTLIKFVTEFTRAFVDVTARPGSTTPGRHRNISTVSGLIVVDSRDRETTGGRVGGMAGDNRIHR